MRRISDLLVPIAIGAAIFALLYYSGLLPPGGGLTTLAAAYLSYIPDISSPYTSWSFEVVTSVIWDQRGFDTYFETSVLFLAIIAAVGLLEGLGKLAKGPETTIITKLVSRVLAPVIVIVSVSVALHGHITPGGGFQGGAVFVITPLLLMLAFRSEKAPERGFRQGRLIFARALAVTLIAVVGLAPLIYSITTGANAYLFQNLAKPGSPFSYPAYLDIGGVRILLSGSLILFNVLEYLAVLTGFTVALYLLTRAFEGGGGK